MAKRIIVILNRMLIIGNGNDTLKKAPTNDPISTVGIIIEAIP